MWWVIWLSNKIDKRFCSDSQHSWLCRHAHFYLHHLKAFTHTATVPYLPKLWPTRMPSCLPTTIYMQSQLIFISCFFIFIKINQRGQLSSILSKNHSQYVAAYMSQFCRTFRKHMYNPFIASRPILARKFAAMLACIPCHIQHLNILVSIQRAIALEQLHI